MAHYEIDSNSKYPRTSLYNEYNDNISFNRTEFMSVKIEVLDTEPQMAADIANDIASLLDSTINNMRKERAIKALEIVEKEYLTLNNQIEAFEDSLYILRQKGVIDYESQTEVFSDAYAIAITQGNISGAKNLEEKLKIMADYGGAYVSIRDFLEYEKKQLSELKAKYAEAKVEAEQDLPNKFIVDDAYKAEKKSYPVRWLIVVTSTFSACFLALLMLIVFSHYRNVVK